VKGSRIVAPTHDCEQLIALDRTKSPRGSGKTIVNGNERFAAKKTVITVVSRALRHGERLYSSRRVEQRIFLVMTTSPFSSIYSEAREKFVHTAEEAGASLYAYQHPERGPNGEVLFTDCAWIGPKVATSVLVLVSGTHGVEGFCGSGAQIDWLRRKEYSLLGADTAVLLIHALNPYGFAWKRRVTHENVDLNRNFVDFSQPLPVNAAYDTLAAALKPDDWSEESQTNSRKMISQFAQTNGWPALAQAVSGGQFSHPDGLFFGGFAPTWSRVTLEEIFAQHLVHATDIGIVDFHTGLGPEGYGELIISNNAGSPEHLRAVEWHGLAAKCIATGESVSAELAGDWMCAAPELLAHAQVTGVSLEFGTVDSSQVLEALRADNWLHAHGDPSGPQAAAVKAQIFGAFFIDSDEWRGMILGQSLMAIRQSMNGLARSRSAL